MNSNLCAFRMDILERARAADSDDFYVLFSATVATGKA